MEQTRRERRVGVEPIPDDLEQLLSPAQYASLRQAQSFGWRLQFVRRPLCSDPLPFVYNPSTQHYSVLEADGTFTISQDLKIR